MACEAAEDTKVGEVCEVMWAGDSRSHSGHHNRGDEGRKIHDSARFVDLQYERTYNIKYNLWSTEDLVPHYELGG